MSTNISQFPGRSIFRLRWLCLLVVLFYGLGVPFLAAGLNAAEWSVESRASLTGMFDDNIRLSDTDKQSEYGAILEPQLDIIGISPNWDANIMLDLSIARYANDPVLDSEDPRLRFVTSYRSQLSEFRLEGEVSRRSTLITEETDSGNFSTTTERDLFEIMPSWIYSLSAKDSLTLGAGWTEANFKSDELTDYRTLTANAGWARQVTRADLFSFTFIVDHSESESTFNLQTIDLESDLYGALARWDHTFSERLKTSVAAGPQFYTTDKPVVVNSVLQTTEEDAFGARFSAGAEYQLSEKTAFDIEASREISPSSGGLPLERSALEARARHQFIPRLSGNLRTYFQLDNDPTDSSSESSERNYFSVETELVYEMALDWDLSASYRFRTQDTGTSNRANSNAVFATITYRQ
jgi:hypothetical protein